MGLLRKVTDIGKNFKNAIKTLDEKVAKVGWFESAKYENGMPVANIAAIQEYGAPSRGIPSRSFIRSTMREKRKEWGQIARNLAVEVLNNKRTAHSALEVIGLVAQGDVKDKISNITSPALKEATIQNRLRKRANKKTVGLLTKPLVDTGHMLATVTHVVENK